MKPRGRRLRLERLERRVAPITTFYVSLGSIDSASMPTTETRAAIDDAVNHYEFAADVDFRLVRPGQRPHFTISSRRLGSSAGPGFEARGKAQPETGQIWFSSLDVFQGGRSQLAKILTHEIGHMFAFFGRSHSRDPSCIMNSNASGSANSEHPPFCKAESDLLIRRYGPSEAVRPGEEPPVFEWHNDARPTDTNLDGRTTAIDALLVINRIGTVADPAVDPGPVRPDADGDGFVRAVDAIMVINAI